MERRKRGGGTKRHIKRPAKLAVKRLANPYQETYYSGIVGELEAHRSYYHKAGTGNAAYQHWVLYMR